MKNQLPPLVDSVIIHYGCTKFENKEHKVHWIGAISHDPGKKYFFKHNDEVKMIEELRDYMLKNKDKMFVHWSMNKPNFGFMALERRYHELAKKEIKLSPALEIDLSEYLKIKYGINYIDRENGRLNNLAKLNSFSGFQVEVEVKDLNQASDRLELIFSITQAEGQGRLIIDSLEKDESPMQIIENKYPKIFKPGLGYPLFLKMLSIYKEEPKYFLSNFSFLYYAMDNDYLVCYQSEFREFLEAFDIILDKIDSRQSGVKTNKRFKLYQFQIELLTK